MEGDLGVSGLVSAKMGSESVWTTDGRCMQRKLRVGGQTGARVQEALGARQRRQPVGSASVAKETQHPVGPQRQKVVQLQCPWNQRALSTPLIDLEFHPIGPSSKWRKFLNT